MSILMRPICILTGHRYRTIKRDNRIWIRECVDCGKIKKVVLVC